MSNPENPAAANNGARKAYSVNIQVKAQSSTSCAFCWFILTVYPTLKGMTDRDSVTFKAHLENTHGLRDEIKP
jgi:hypothetical protein